MSGVVLTLAGVAATGDEEFFSIISAGIFLLFFFLLNPQRILFFGILRAKKNFRLCPFYLTFIRKTTEQLRGCYVLGLLSDR